MSQEIPENPDRRKYPRVPFPCKIVLNSPLRLLVSHTENISEGGVRVILDEKLNPHVNIGIEIFFIKERPLKCKGKVVWVKERVNPLEHQAVLFDTGIEFVDLSQADREYIKKIVNALLSESI